MLQTTSAPLRATTTSPRISWLALVCAALVSCSAQITEPDEADGTSGGNGPGPGPGGGGEQNVPGAGNGPGPGAGNGTGAGPSSGGRGGTNGTAGAPNNNNGGASPGSGGSSAGNGSGGSVVTSPIPPSALPAEKSCTSNSPGPRALRRLTAGEFKASIIDLFGGDAAAPVGEVFNDQKVLGFSVDSATLQVQGLNADQLMNSAEAVAKWAVGSKLSQIATCQTKDTNCAKTLIKSFGRKAFRVTLADDDARITAYSNLFMAEESFAAGAEAVVAAMLQSPNFLYRTELGAKGASGATITLTPFEVASSLSYLLTGSGPDATLLDAADQVSRGSMMMTAMIDQQANRLLALPAAQNAVMNFMSGWLGLDKLTVAVKDANVFDFPEAVRTDMATEQRTFLLDIFNSSGNVGSLFSANYSFVNKNLAQYYGLDANAFGNTFQKVTYTSNRDGGLLGLGGILTGYAKSDMSSPTQRGHLVRTRLMCQDVPPPPAGLDTKFTPTGTARTTRQKYEQEHAAKTRGECYGCHELMDPIGFAFEHYDAFGRYRAQDAGENVDDSAVVYAANAKDGNVNVAGVKGLSTYLSTNDDVKRCMVRYWSYYAYGSPSWQQDACTYNSINQEATQNSYALKSVLMGIIHAARFTARTQD